MHVCVCVCLQVCVCVCVFASLCVHVCVTTYVSSHGMYIHTTAGIFHTLNKAGHIAGHVDCIQFNTLSCDLVN